MRKSFLVYVTLILLLLMTTAFSVEAQRRKPAASFNYSYITESMTRKRVVASAMPAYPEELLSRGMTGVFVAKIEIDPSGNILTVKVKPEIDPLIKKSLADALSQWKFKMNALINYKPEETTLSKLSFQFSIKDGKGSVEMYEPPPDAADTERLDNMQSSTEHKEWIIWQQIYPQMTKTKE